MIVRSDFASCSQTRKSASGLGDFSTNLIGFGSVFISSQCGNPCLNDQCLQLYNSISCQLHNCQNASIICILCNGHKCALDIFTSDSSRFPCMPICYLIESIQNQVMLIETIIQYTDQFKSFSL